MIHSEAENGLPDVVVGAEQDPVIMIGSCQGPICI